MLVCVCVYAHVHVCVPAYVCVHMALEGELFMEKGLIVEKR